MTALLPQEEVIPAIIAIVMVVAIYGVFGIVCAVLAPSRGRSAVGWFFIGVITQCFGIILILLLPNLKLEEEKRRRQEEETRRLREQLKKERHVSDQRHVTNRDRIDVHDRALGVDTSAAERRLIEAGAAPPPVPKAIQEPVESLWYYAIDGEQRGPMPQSKLRMLFRDGRIDTTTLVWRDGLTNWTPIGDVPEILTTDRP